MPFPPLSFISMHATESDERARRASFLVLAIAIAVRLIAAALVPLAPDETYYWEWSRHLAAGYLDHPPLIAFAIRLGTALLGATPLGVRLGSVVAGTLASLVLVYVSGALGGDHSRVRAAAIIACMPLAQIGLALATPDATLLLFWALALAALVAAWRADAAPRARLIAWALAGLVLGAALEAKYTALLLAAGLVAALLAQPTLRLALATPGPYLAGALALALFAPNLLWNAQHGWLSFNYQLAHGLALHRGSPLNHELQLFGGQIALVSPLLLAVLAIPVVCAMQRRDDATRTAFAIIAAVTWLAFVASALRSAVEPNWQAPAYLSAIVLAATYRGGARWRTLLRAACALGAAITLIIYAHAIAPFVPTNIALDPTAAGFGWDSLAAHVDFARGARIGPPGATWVAGERYQEASELAYYLPDHPTTFTIDVHARANQYDLWPLFPERARKGDGLVLVLGLYTLAENDPVIAALRPHFGKITLREIVPLKRGKIIRAYRRVWVLDDWTGTWPSIELAH
jgi:4-amino-4-deoxy-L-arabinose transferase-like glycosyltransferase